MTRTAHLWWRSFLSVCEFQQLIYYIVIISTYEDNIFGQTWCQVDFPLLLICLICQFVCYINVYEVHPSYDSKFSSTSWSARIFVANVGPKKVMTPDDIEAATIPIDIADFPNITHAYATTGREKEVDGDNVIAAGVSARVKDPWERTQMKIFYGTYALDVMIRISRLILLFAFYEASSEACMVIVYSCFIEQCVYGIGTWKYFLMLLDDQDYRRDVLTTLDKMTNRLRYTVRYF